MLPKQRLVGSMTRLLKRLSTLILAIMLLPAGIGHANSAETTVFDALRDGGHVLLLRHAIAPGFGDPAGFDPSDCATQRNLSADGRAQARALGERLRAEGLGNLPVLSSVWCRCQETARELALTEPELHAGLNSFFQDRARRDTIVAALRDLLAALAALADGDSAVLVTHQVNIQAITGRSVASGAGLVVRPDATGQVVVVGDFPP